MKIYLDMQNSHLEFYCGCLHFQYWTTDIVLAVPLLIYKVWYFFWSQMYFIHTCTLFRVEQSIKIESLTLNLICRDHIVSMLFLSKKISSFFFFWLFSYLFFQIQVSSYIIQPVDENNKHIKLWAYLESIIKI